MKKIIFSVILIFIMGFVVFLFISNQSGDAVVNFVDKKDITIKIDNSSPISDEIAIEKNDGEKFSIKSFYGSTKYEIYVKQINSLNSINADYIKLYLCEGSSNRPLTDVLIFNDLKVSNSNMDSRSLYVGNIRKNEVIKLNLKMWLSDNYTISNEKRNFEVVVGVRAIN
ncbi:MAG: hypothetical protein E7160_02900 [Firmicutes bacterium]|nr:hypothetical protein [Bacillota bacterium]